MSKPIFKIVDERGRVVVPKNMRESVGIAIGDVVAVTVSKGSINVKKALVLEDSAMPMDAKIAYAETIAREMSTDALTDLLELAVKLLQEQKDK